MSKLCQNYVKLKGNLPTIRIIKHTTTFLCQTNISIIKIGPRIRKVPEFSSNRQEFTSRDFIGDGIQMMPRYNQLCPNVLNNARVTSRSEHIT